MVTISLTKWSHAVPLLVVLLALLLRDASGVRKPSHVYFPDLVELSDEPKPFTVRVTKFVCVDTPYQVAELLQCKTILRRNRPTIGNITLHVPGALTKFYMQIRTFYRFTEFQSVPFEIVLEVCDYLRHPPNDAIGRHVFAVVRETMPNLLYRCPHGNTTYQTAFWMEEKFFPQSTPAGDYRQNIRFSTPENETVFAYEVYFSVRRKGILKSVMEW